MRHLAERRAAKLNQPLPKLEQKRRTRLVLKAREKPLKLAPPKRLRRPARPLLLLKQPLQNVPL